MDVKIAESWKKVLESEFDQEYFHKLIDFVKDEYKSKKIFPPGPYIFRAFNECSFEDCRVVILGQDPYHTPGVANGLAFGATEGQRIPPSLLNIYKEIKNEFGTEIPKSPDLTRWAKQGVLLLNATLTVQAGKAGSHQGKGWEEFTDAVIKIISDKKKHVVFILWGAYAGKKESLIDGSKHLILKSPHPSPFSADKGFFGNNHFKKANEYLKAHGLEEVKW
jgi:uracil-DNA glycosylase